MSKPLFPHIPRGKPQYPHIPKSRLKQLAPIPGFEVEVSKYPQCDFCWREAHYDGATIHGPWGYMCEEHFIAKGRGLGLGKGQRLVVKEEKKVEMVKITGEKFPLGQTVVTAGVNEWVQGTPAFGQFIAKSLQRHSVGDWGNLDPEDVRENERSLKEGFRLLSAYGGPPSPFRKVWIITEADRSVTTVLFPEEY